MQTWIEIGNMRERFIRSRISNGIGSPWIIPLQYLIFRRAEISKTSREPDGLMQGEKNPTELTDLPMGDEDKDQPIVLSHFVEVKPDPEPKVKG